MVLQTPNSPAAAEECTMPITISLVGRERSRSRAEKIILMLQRAAAAVCARRFRNLCRRCQRILRTQRTLFLVQWDLANISTRYGIPLRPMAKEAWSTRLQ